MDRRRRQRSGRGHLTDAISCREGNAGGTQRRSIGMDVDRALRAISERHGSSVAGQCNLSRPVGEANGSCGAAGGKGIGRSIDVAVIVDRRSRERSGQGHLARAISRCNRDRGVTRATRDRRSVGIGIDAVARIAERSMRRLAGHHHLPGPVGQTDGEGIIRSR